MIKAEIILDSFSAATNSRLTTWILEYPRMVHSELLTHRSFSKNASSSRAIPIEKIIKDIRSNPAMPVWWGKNQSGMQANEELDDKQIWAGLGHTVPEGEKFVFTQKEWAKNLWLEARDEAIKYAEKLRDTGLHKQIANRILEPWFNIRIIMSATEIENFFALREHADAQPEIRELAAKMLEAYNNSTPKILHPGDWHIPFGDRFDEDRLLELEERIYGKRQSNTYYFKQNEELKKKISVARCARISYLNFEGKDDYQADLNLFDKLTGSIPLHLSPCEHQAEAQDKNEFIGNFRGFKQYRKFFLNENLKDNRVIKWKYNKESRSLEKI